MSIFDRINKNKDLDKVKERSQPKSIEKLKHKDKRRFSKIRNAIKRNSKK
jgi:hypothetical protein